MNGNQNNEEEKDEFSNKVQEFLFGKTSRHLKIVKEIIRRTIKLIDNSKIQH